MSGVGLGAGGWSGNVLGVIQANLIGGVASLASGAATFTVSIPNVGTTNYVIVVTIQNTTDVTARHLHATVTAKTASSFSFQTAQTTDTANYKANYLIYKL